MQKNRQKAADDLATKLSDSCDSASDASHYIITHSHAGNVALYALKDPTLRSKIAGLICMNTPFICPLRRNTRQILSFGGVFLLVWIISILIFFLYKFLESLNLESIPWEGWILLLTGGIVFIGIFLVILMIAVTRLSNAIGKSWFNLFSWLKEWIAKKQDELMEQLRLPETRNLPILCLSSAGDEVMTVFSFVEALASIPFILLHPLFISTVFCIILFGQVFGWVPHFYSENWLTSSGNYVVAGLLIVIVPLFIINSFVRWKVIGLSKGDLINSVFVKVSFALVPVNSFNAKFHHLGPDRPELLSHSVIYNDKNAIGEMTKWIKNINPKMEEFDQPSA